MWYNKETQELQSDKPWGAGWVAQEIIEELYHMWEEVEDFFVPPAKEPTTDEKIAIIENDYEVKLKDLTDLLVVSVLAGKETDTLKVNFQALSDEKDAKILEILEGL